MQQAERELHILSYMGVESARFEVEVDLFGGGIFPCRRVHLGHTNDTQCIHISREPLTALLLHVVHSRKRLLMICPLGEDPFRL